MCEKAFWAHFRTTADPSPHQRKQPFPASMPCWEKPAANTSEGGPPEQALSHPARLWASQVSGRT